ncbi:MAG: hypothetical protein PUE49_04770 [Eggerthellales bacterium]|nr:hypothetical protein [Eggerthellales bacterium]
MKKKFAQIIALVSCLVLCFAMLGCSSDNGEDAQEAQKNRTYMSQLNTATETLNEKLDAFSEAASEGDLVKMRTGAQKVTAVIDEIRGYEVPDKLKDISAKYLEGFDSLESAMGAYIALYEDIESGKNVDAKDKLKDIQIEYDKGIAALQEADAQAKELK